MAFCEVCGKSKTFVLNGREVPAMCDCEAEERDAWKRSLKDGEQRAHARHIQKLGYVKPEENFANDDGRNAELTKVCKNFVEHFGEVGGLILYGSFGNGKTFMANCIANALREKGYTCVTTSFMQIEARLMETRGKQEIIDQLTKCDLLVLDDFGAERDTSYMSEVVYSVIDPREKPLIITTNLTGDELANPETVREKRIYSRLFGKCIPYKVEGMDRRRESLRDKYIETMEVLKA